MTEDQIKNIWERYYKADASRIQTKGESGLGMAIVHELVQIHGGEIEVSSAPGRGTTFKLHFPKAPADQQGVDYKYRVRCDIVKGNIPRSWRESLGSWTTPFTFAAIQLNSGA